MQTRRLIAAGVVVVIVIVIALLLAGSGGDTSALKNYNASVYNLARGSVQNAQGVLKTLAKGPLTGISRALATAEQKARQDVKDARRLHAPSQLAAAQSALVTVMQLRQQGLLLIADNAQSAANKSSSKDAVYQISLGTSQLYTSDVIYKTIVTTDIAKALNAAGAGQQPINGAQVVPDLGWLDRTWIADKIHAQLSTAQANVNNDQPGLSHGDEIAGVTVDNILAGNGGSYTIPAASAQTWVLSVTNSGQTTENAVGCSVKVNSAGDSGTATIPTIAAGSTDSCTVHLRSAPPKGPYSVTATVEKVPGEKNLTNNTITFNVNFT